MRGSAFEDGRGRPTAADRARAVGVCFATPTADSVAANNTKVAGESPLRDGRCLQESGRRVYAEAFWKAVLVRRRLHRDIGRQLRG